MWIKVIHDACVTAPKNTRGKVWEQFQPDAWIAAVLLGNESQIFEMRNLPVIEAVNTLTIQLGDSADSLKISHGFSFTDALLIYPSLSNRTPLPLQACSVIKNPPTFICLNVQRNVSNWLITDLLSKNQVTPKK